LRLAGLLGGGYVPSPAGVAGFNPAHDDLNELGLFALVVGLEVLVEHFPLDPLDFTTIRLDKCGVLLVIQSQGLEQNFGVFFIKGQSLDGKIGLSATALLAICLQVFHQDGEADLGDISTIGVDELNVLSIS